MKTETELLAAETTIADHVERFWRFLETETVRIQVDMRRDTSSVPYWDMSSFSDAVAKALVAERRAPAQCTLASNATTISCSGKDITIACDDHDTKRAVMDALTQPIELPEGFVLGDFKPCYMINEAMNMVEIHFEDVACMATPLIDGVYHWIDKLVAFDDQRVVGLNFWIYKPPVTPLADEAGMREAVERAHKAIASLPLDAFGYGEDDAGRWPLRDELLQSISAALRPSQAAAVLPRGEETRSEISDLICRELNCNCEGDGDGADTSKAKCWKLADAILALARPPELENEVIERVVPEIDTNTPASLRGLATWLRNWKKNPGKYHDPIPMAAEQLDRTAYQVECALRREG